MDNNAFGKIVAGGLDAINYIRTENGKPPLTLEEAQASINQTRLPEASFVPATLENTAMSPNPLIDEALATAIDLAEGSAAAKKDSAMIGGSGYERIEADHYNTPAENLDCLLQHVAIHENVWEPAVGIGNLATRLHELGHTVWSSDIIDYGFDERFTLGDFFKMESLPDKSIRALVSNPPYETIDMTEERWAHLKPLAVKYGITSNRVSLAELFCRHAVAVMKESRGQVAMFLRNEFDCSKGRMDMFSMPPFHKKIIVTKRPRWVEGSTGSPRHNYSWFVWDWRHIRGDGGVAYSHPSYATKLSGDRA